MSQAATKKLLTDLLPLAREVARAMPVEAKSARESLDIVAGVLSQALALKLPPRVRNDVAACLHQLRTRRSLLAAAEAIDFAAKPELLMTQIENYL